MLLLPLPLRRLQPGDDLARALCEAKKIESGDIVAISSKVVATVENAFIDLRSVQASSEANEWSGKCGRSPAFCQAVLEELRRMNGTVLGACPGAMLTEVRPEGLATGSILTANAGLDESNAPEGRAIGWPMDPALSTTTLRKSLEKISGGGIAVILTDSCVHPRRHGVTAFALCVSGVDPLLPQQGKKDLCGKPLRITTEAVADQLATAANFLMGNAAQSIPAVVIRDHGLPLSDFEGWVPAIPAKDDLFSGLL